MSRQKTVGVTWEMTPPPPLTCRMAPLLGVLGPVAVVWGGYYVHEPEPRSPIGYRSRHVGFDGATFDSVRREWHTIPGIPSGPFSRSSDDIARAYAAGHVLSWGLLEDSGEYVGFAYSIEHGEWRRISPPDPTYWEVGSPLVAMGDRVARWGGGRHRKGETVDSGVVYDVAADEWRPMAPAPIEGCSGHTSTWSGSELLIWDGHGATGAVYDPAADTWRRMAPGPLEPRGSHVALWTGSELMIWGGEHWDGEHRTTYFSDAAMYDPANDEWRTVAPSPFPHRGGRGAPCGDDVVAIAGGIAPEGAYHEPDSVLRLYDLTEDAWDMNHDRTCVPGGGALLAGDGGVWAWGRTGDDPVWGQGLAFLRATRL